VKDESAAGHGLPERRGVEEIAFDHPEPGIGRGILEKTLESRREVVEADDVIALGEQAVHEGAADETGRAGDEDGSAFRNHAMASIG
jgi:hypothetical protein